MSEEIIQKANYCLNCKLKPCSNNGCPLNNNIPEFIKMIKENNYEEAYSILTETSVLQAICGRICPHKKQCEGSCIRGIKSEAVEIGSLEAFVGDYAIKNNLKIKKSNNIIKKEVAVVGGGPAGLTCAAFLAKEGIHVTIYEKHNYLGGLLVHGIPEFRLSNKIVEKSIKQILDLNIDVKYNQILGENLKLDELVKMYDKIFLAFGANVSLNMGIEGEKLEGVYGANELLEFAKFPNFKEKTVVINGGGNVAIDIARVIKRKGAKKVLIIYRRALEQMPAEQKEIQDAQKEGIEIWFQNNIVKIIGNRNVEKVELIKTKLIKKDGETRLAPIDIKDSNYIISTDYVVMALGSKTDEFVKKLGLQLDSKNNIIIDKFYKTSNPKIYAGGDIIGR